MVQRRRRAARREPRPGRASDRRRPRSGEPRAPVFVDAHGLHEAESSHDRRRAERSWRPSSASTSSASLRRDAVRGHRTAHPRASAQRLFADMRFTMARPEISCHPERLLEGATLGHRCGALLLRAGAEPRQSTRGVFPDTRGATSTRCSASGSMSSAGRLGGAYRVLVDENDHVDREAAVRAGIAFYGKNTMAITRRHGSWVVLGALVTDVEIEPSPPLELDCGDCRLCIDACPTGALDEPGVARRDEVPLVLDAGARSDSRTRIARSWGTWSTAATSARTCARGTAASRSDAARTRSPAKHRAVSYPLVDWLERDVAELVADFDRLYVPRNDPAGFGGTRSSPPATSEAPLSRRVIERYAVDDDPMLGETAAWALGRSARTIVMTQPSTTSDSPSSCTRCEARWQRLRPSLEAFVETRAGAPAGPSSSGSRSACLRASSESSSTPWPLGAARSRRLGGARRATSLPPLPSEGHESRRRSTPTFQLSGEIR